MTTALLWANRNVEAMRGMALALLPVLTWRHHGIGVLQGYLREGGRPEIRMHVWSPRLVKEGISGNGDVHDHRFAMVSHVLCGHISHEEWDAHPHADGDHEMLELTHARAAASTNFHGPTKALPDRYLVRTSKVKIPSGFSYHFAAHRFHRSILAMGEDEVAVTVVEKWDETNRPARLLYPVGTTPVMAFGHEISQELVRHVLRLADVCLRKEPA